MFLRKSELYEQPFRSYLVGPSISYIQQVGRWVPWYHIVLLYCSSTVHRGGIYQFSVRSIHYSPQRGGICQFSVQSVHYSCNFEATGWEICKSHLCRVTIVNLSDLKLVNSNSVQYSVLLISCYVLARNWGDDTQCAQYVAQFKGTLANSRTS